MRRRSVVGAEFGMPGTMRAALASGLMILEPWYIDMVATNVTSLAFYCDRISECELRKGKEDRSGLGELAYLYKRHGFSNEELLLLLKAVLSTTRIMFMISETCALVVVSNCRASSGDQIYILLLRFGPTVVFVPSFLTLSNHYLHSSKFNARAESSSDCHRTFGNISVTINISEA
jgi:hypothetical protein